MTETLKAALDGWFGALAFWLVLVWVASLYFVPKSCEGDTCATCPWNRDGENRRRYWTWRRRQGHLEVVVDAMYVVFFLGRVVCDLILGEATWTLPVLLGFGVWMLKFYFEDLRELERVREKAREVEA